MMMTKISSQLLFVTFIVLLCCDNRVVLLVEAVRSSTHTSNNNNNNTSNTSMNKGGSPYKIANSNTFPTNYHNNEYFEVYSKPIQTLYSQVHWTNHGNIPLPEDIVKRFAKKGSVMAITGYEVDQVFLRGKQKTSTKKVGEEDATAVEEEENEEEEDVPVPITWAYNHHYTAFILNSKKARLVKVKEPSNDPLMASQLGIHHHGNEEYWVQDVFGVNSNDGDVDEDDDVIIPQIHFFSEGNGGEMRKSYHGYPKQYAQLIESPDTFHITPMQIDTWNRNMNNDTFLPGPLPKNSDITITTSDGTQNSSTGSTHVKYNRLLECPCSDRLSIEWSMAYVIVNKEDGENEEGDASSTTTTTTTTKIKNNNNHQCMSQITNETECFFAVQQVIPSNHYQLQRVENDDSSYLAPGCNAQVGKNGTVDVIWNTVVRAPEVVTTASIEEVTEKVTTRMYPIENSSNDNDNNHHKKKVVGVVVSEAINVTLTIDTTVIEKRDDAVQIEISGPADRWLGIGFGADTMCIHRQADECPDGGPYAIVVLGSDNNDNNNNNNTLDTIVVMERKLDFHGRGVKLIKQSLTVLSHHVNEQGIRTVLVSRPMKGVSDKHYTFDATTASSSSSSIPVILAQGCKKDMIFEGRHCIHRSTTLNFMTVGIPKPICKAGIQGTIDGNPFPNQVCAPFPTSVLQEQNNPTCHIQTYHGGQRCCRHGKYLLDKDQDIPWSDQPLVYHLKFRFYFEEYQYATTLVSSTSTSSSSSTLSSSSSNPESSLDTVSSSSSVSLPSHRNLVRFYWQTEAWAAEYDILPCPKGTPPSQCVQVITSQWKVQDFVHDCSIHDASYCTGKGSGDPTKTEGIQLIYAGPHCHAPTCLSMELYNADTGRLLCHVEPIHGRGTNELYDEYGFLAIPPCLWGDTAEGLEEPELLSLDTTLLSIKRSNSTLPHTGEMASWQMRGIIIPRVEKDLTVNKEEPIENE